MTLSNFSRNGETVNYTISRLSVKNIHYNKKNRTKKIILYTKIGNAGVIVVPMRSLVPMLIVVPSLRQCSWKNYSINRADVDGWAISWEIIIIEYQSGIKVREIEDV